MHTEADVLSVVQRQRQHKFCGLMIEWMGRDEMGSLDVTFVSSRYKVIGPYLTWGVSRFKSVPVSFIGILMAFDQLSMGELDSPFFIFRFKLKVRCDEEKVSYFCIDSKWYEYLNTRFVGAKNLRETPGYAVLSLTST